MGSGKSTILRTTLLRIIELNEQRLQKYPMPFLIRFKKLVFDSEEPVLDALQDEYHRVCPSAPDRDFGHELETGSLVVLLDGLDELEDDDTIEMAVQSVNNLIRKYPEIRVIITSRILEIFSRKTALLAGFTVVKIRNMSLRQIRDFVNNWFGSDSQKGKSLVRQLTHPTALSMLQLNPLV